MAKLFLSHSSRDKEFVRQLAADLRVLGHTPWLDEWEIKVGECIVTKIEAALADCDYVILVLTPDAVKSGWVEREWKIRYWDEINTRKLAVLPALLVDCDIPPMLRTKKYADFRTSRSLGFHQLMGAIEPIRIIDESTDTPKPTTLQSEVAELIERVQSAATPLATTIAQALSLAIRVGASDLEQFARNELRGWTTDEGPRPYRQFEVLIAYGATLNTDYLGWGDDYRRAWDEMKREPKLFVPYRLQLSVNVASIETAAQQMTVRGLTSFTIRLGDVMPQSKDPNRELTAYGRGDVYRQVVEGIRRKLTEMLLQLLPVTTISDQRVGPPETA